MKFATRSASTPRLSADAGAAASRAADARCARAGARNRAATKAQALVSATMTNGARRSVATATSPPKAGPTTFPAEFAAERTPLVKAIRAGSATSAM